MGVPSQESSLSRMKRNGFNPKTVIDVGAYVGNWTIFCKKLFPNASVLMIEPQVDKRPHLECVMKRFNDLKLESVLVGAFTQERVGFHEMETASSVLAEMGKNILPSIFLPMKTLETITKDTIYSHPDFIKLDVQGYELEVLRGGEALLRSAQAILMEVNLIEIYKDVPLFHQAVSFMAEREFLIHDVCSMFRRPYDGALWQMDVIFVNQSSHLLSSKRWN